MKRWVVLLLATTLLFIMIVISRSTQAPIQTVEGFGLFGGCSTIAYDKLVNDMYTQNELQAFFTNEWNTQTPDQKNSLIATWDQMSCDDQNNYYTLVTTERTKRAAVDSVAPAPSPAPAPASS